MSQFYLELVPSVETSLVQYMNRMGSIMALLKSPVWTTATDGTGTMKDFLWTLQEENQKPLDFYLFGVLQGITNWHGLLQRLEKLTPENHISLDTLDRAQLAIAAMNQRVDRAVKLYRELEKELDTLVSPPEYMLDESRWVCCKGRVCTLGRFDQAITGTSGCTANSACDGACCSWTRGRLADACFLLLFNDSFLMCEPVTLLQPNPRYRPPRPGSKRKGQPKEITVTKYMIRRLLRRHINDQDQCSIKCYSQNVFSLLSHSQGFFLFKAASQADKDMWVNAFSESWQLQVEVVCEACS